MIINGGSGVFWPILKVCIPFQIRFSRPGQKKINLFGGSGSNQRPDCVVIMNTDRECSVILGADRLQIPIVSLVDSNIPLELCKEITYAIPANDSIQFVYPSRNSITKKNWSRTGRCDEGSWRIKTHQSTLSIHPIGITNYCMHASIHKLMGSVEWSQLETGLSAFMDWTRIEPGSFASAAGGFFPNRGGRFVHSSQPNGTGIRGSCTNRDSSKKAPHAELSGSNSVQWLERGPGDSLQ